MKCIECGNKMNKTTKTYVANLENCVIIIKNVPALICPSCKEVYYKDDVFQKIEEIISKLKELVNDVAVIEYQDKIA